MRLTEHALDRARQRAGLSREAMERLSSRACERGIHARDVSGPARAYLYKLAVDHPDTTPIVYGQFVFVFGSTDPVLITVWQVPLELRATFKKALQRKAAA